MAQTRCAGIPPLISKIQARDKFLRTISSKPVSYQDSHLDYLEYEIQNYIDKLPAYYFTGLATKARVNITQSACLEVIRKEGGTEAQIAEILSNHPTAKPLVRDLETGIPTGVEAEKKDLGNYIFWTCLDVVLQSELVDLQTVQLCIVNEPAKNRAVTKGPAALKVILDVVSKICSSPLKYIESSSSGMSKSSHAWEFWKKMFSEEWKNLIFNPSETHTEESIGSKCITKYFEPIYSYSTDYTEATDSFEFEIARTLGLAWMKACGIPSVLQGIVLAICFEPRRVFYKDYDDFHKVDYRTLKNERYVVSQKGILMGDP